MRIVRRQCADITFGGLEHGFIPAPAIGHVEGVGVKVRGLPLTQHEYRLHFVEFAARSVPEIQWHKARDVAAEAVDAGLFYPELHGLHHVLPHFRLRVVEVDDVGPVVPRGGVVVALVVLGVPVGVLLHQCVVPGRVVRHPVQNDMQAKGMGAVHEMLHVVERAELRVHRAVVLHGIGAAQRAFAVLFADGAQRHEPDDIDAQFLEAWQLLFRFRQRAFRGELPHVDLVEGGAAGPFRVLHTHIGLWCIGRDHGRGDLRDFSLAADERGQQQCEQDNGELVHGDSCTEN